MPGEPFDLETVNCFVLHKQHLDGSCGATDIARVVRDIGGLHNTDPSTPYLSLYARVPGFSRSVLDEEMYVRRTLVRIRCMRNTMHILPRDLIPAVFASTQPLTGANAERFLQYRGVSDDEYGAVSEKIVDLLSDGGMTLFEIKKATGPVTNLSAVLTLMCDRGILVRGETPSWRSNAYTYHLFTEYLPGLSLSPVDESAATVELVRLHLSAFGPATVNDIAWWTGLGKTKVQNALKSLPVDHIRVRAMKGDFLLLSNESHELEKACTKPDPIVNLLPCLDPYVMGYKERDRYLSKENYGYVFDRSGNSTRTILVNGRISGVWDYSAGEITQIKYYLFEGAADVSEDVIATARQTGYFIAGRQVSVRESRTMVPLTERTPGGFMTPLKER